MPLLLPLICTLYSGGHQPDEQTNVLFTLGAELYPASKQPRYLPIFIFNKMTQFQVLISQNDKESSSFPPSCPLSATFSLALAPAIFIDIY